MQYLDKRAQHESLKSSKTNENGEDLEHTRFRANSQASSECSQQPSVEFLERLERAKKESEMNIIDSDLDAKLVSVYEPLEDHIHGLDV